MSSASRHSNGRAPPVGSVGAGAGRSASVFEEVPELLQGVSPRLAGELLGVRAPVIEIEHGPWSPPFPTERAGPHFGLLALDGLVLRRVTLGGRSGAELLGSGDLLQPWVLQPPYDTLIAEPGWDVLEPARFAVLDGRFAARVAPYPEVAVALVGRAIERTRMLAFQHVASHIPGLGDRLEALLWALADRWGRVTPDGVLVPLRLTHATLAELVGAARPSVSTALAQLAREGNVARDHAGWLLAADPPQAEKSTPRAGGRRALH